MRHLQVVDLIGEFHLHSADDVHLYEHPTPLTKAQVRLLSLGDKQEDSVFPPAEATKSDGVAINARSIHCYKQHFRLAWWDCASGRDLRQPGDKWQKEKKTSCFLVSNSSLMTFSSAVFLSRRAATCCLSSTTFIAAVSNSYTMSRYHFPVVMMASLGIVSNRHDLDPMSCLVID